MINHFTLCFHFRARRNQQSYISFVSFQPSVGYGCAIIFVFPRASPSLPLFLRSPTHSFSLFYWEFTCYFPFHFFGQILHRSEFLSSPYPHFLCSSPLLLRLFNIRIETVLLLFTVVGVGHFKILYVTLRLVLSVMQARLALLYWAWISSQRLWNCYLLWKYF